MKHDSPGVREVVVVLGKTGWGKSWWTKCYSKQFPRRLVYDPSGTFPVKAYLPIDDIIGEITDDEHKGKPFNYGFLDENDIPQAASALWAIGNNLLIVEECALVFEKGMSRMPPWARDHCFIGRHQSCSLVLIAQRPTYIPVDFRSQANRVISFCQHEGTDTDWLQNLYGKERADRLSELPKFSCFDIHDGIIHEYSIVDKVKEEFGVTLDKHTESAYPTFVQ